MAEKRGNRDECVLCGGYVGAPRRVVGPLGGPLYAICTHCVRNMNAVADDAMKAGREPPRLFGADCLCDVADVLGTSMAGAAAWCRCPNHGGEAVTTYGSPWVVPPREDGL